MDAIQCAGLASHPHDPTTGAVDLAPQPRDALLLDAELPVAEHLGVHVVDTRALVCGTSRCDVVTSDGAIVYRDDNHLTDRYAVSVAEYLVAAIGEVITVPSS